MSKVASNASRHSSLTVPVNKSSTDETCPFCSSVLWGSPIPQFSLSTHLIVMHFLEWGWRNNCTELDLLVRSSLMLLFKWVWLNEIVTHGQNECDYSLSCGPWSPSISSQSSVHSICRFILISHSFLPVLSTDVPLLSADQYLTVLICRWAVLWLWHFQTQRGKMSFAGLYCL